MEQVVQTRSWELLHLGDVTGWEFLWIGEELSSQQYVVWRVANFVDGFPVACHSELRWVQLGCFGTDEKASCVWQVEERFFIGQESYTLDSESRCDSV